MIKIVINDSQNKMLLDFGNKTLHADLYYYNIDPGCDDIEGSIKVENILTKNFSALILSLQAVKQIYLTYDFEDEYIKLLEFIYDPEEETVCISEFLCLSIQGYQILPSQGHIIDLPKNQLEKLQELVKINFKDLRINFMVV